MSVCLYASVRAVKEKRLELSTPKLAQIIVHDVHALTRRSKGQGSRSRGYQVQTVRILPGRQTGLAWVCASVRQLTSCGLLASFSACLANNTERRVVDKALSDRCAAWRATASRVVAVTMQLAPLPADRPRPQIEAVLVLSLIHI